MTAARSLVNRTYLTLAISAGLDCAILDPLDRDLKAALIATEMLLGRDRHCLGYTRAFRAGLLILHLNILGLHLRLVLLRLCLILLRRRRSSVYSSGLRRLRYRVDKRTADYSGPGSDKSALSGIPTRHP